jgi:hypothetical protein
MERNNYADTDARTRTTQRCAAIQERTLLFFWRKTAIARLRLKLAPVTAVDPLGGAGPTPDKQAISTHRLDLIAGNTEPGSEALTECEDFSFQRGKENRGNL